MNLLSLYLDYCSPLLGSKIYHKWCFLSAISALLERRCYLDQGRVGILFPNTYTFLVGPPATGKGFSINLALDFYNQVRGQPPPIRSATKITQAALYTDIHASQRTVLLPGQKPYLNSPAFLIAEELSQALEDFGGGLLTSELIDFYDSKGLNATITKHTISGGLLIIPNPSVVLLAGTQAEYLQSAQQSKIVNSGLSSRILFVVEPEQVEKQYDNILIDEMLRKTIIAQLENIYRFKGIMTLTQDARDEYIRQGNLAQHASQDSLAHFYKNYYGRKPMHILKVAMLLAAMKLRHEVTIEHLNEAVQLMNEIEPDMVQAFGIRSIEKDTDVVSHLLQHIPKPGTWITKKNLLNALFSSGKFLADNGVLANTIKGLVAAGIIKHRSKGDDEWLAKLPNYLQLLKKHDIILEDEPEVTLPSTPMQTSVQTPEASATPDKEPDK